MKKTGFFGKLIYGYDKLEEYLLCGSLVCTTLIVFAQVIMRKVFNDSLTWSEELTRYIFIWQIWLGVSIAQRDKQHIKVELLKSLVKNEKVISVVDIFATLVLIAFNVFLVINGSELVNQMYTRVRRDAPADVDRLQRSAHLVLYPQPAPDRSGRGGY